jgi:pimeloyl-ACP methyl ester carboxylesterase
VLTPSSDGVPIAVHDLGGDGPPLVLAHATGFHGLVWDRFATLLADWFHVWSLDFRAHGASGRGDLSWGAMTGDLLATIAVAGGGQPFVFGHSLGGAVALLTEQATPGTFRAMCLYEPAALPPWALAPSQEHPLSTAARRRRAVFESRDAAYDNYAGKPPLDELSAGALRAYVDHGFADRPDGTVELRCRPDDEAEVFVRGTDSGAFEAIAEVTCPVTFVRGGTQIPGPGMFIELVAEKAPNGRLVTLDRLAHFGPLHDPGAVVPTVLEALGV